MNERRFVVSNVFWRRLGRHLPRQVSDAGAMAKYNRLFLQAVFWRVRTRLPRRGLPSAFSHWHNQFRRYRRWAQRYEILTRRAISSANPSQDLTMAQNIKEPHLARELLSARRSRSTDRCLRRSLQARAPPRGPKKRHARARLLRAGHWHSTAKRKDQTKTLEARRLHVGKHAASLNQKDEPNYRLAHAAIHPKNLDDR